MAVTMMKNLSKNETLPSKFEQMSEDERRYCEKEWAEHMTGMMIFQLLEHGHLTRSRS
jgi:hypothetical protein